MSYSYIEIDSTQFNIPVTILKEDADFLYKYAERTVDGKLHSELIGVYFNYQLTFGRGTGSDYNDLWEKITEPVEFHSVKVPYPDGTGYKTFQAYFSNVSHEIRRVSGTTNYWEGLTVNFIAQEPARS